MYGVRDRMEESITPIENPNEENKTEDENPMDIAKNVAKEICDEIKDNHISTLVYDLPTKDEFSGGKSTIPVFVVVNKFDSEVANKLANIAQKWAKSGVEGPFIAEINDLKGMEDSVPDELWNVSRNYIVLEGTDVLKELPQFDNEYQRAQAELAIRRYIFTLRWTLPQVLHNNFQLKCYMNNLAFYCQLAIQLYHRITKSDTRTPEAHINTFYDEFPDSKQSLETLLNHVYNNEPLESTSVELLTNTIDKVLQKILKKIDELGNKSDIPPTTPPSEPTQPETIQTTETIESTLPPEATQPVQFTHPSQPAQIIKLDEQEPTQPQPTESNQPIQTTQTIEPIDQIKPTEPIEPIKPTEHTEPIEPPESKEDTPHKEPEEEDSE